MVVVLLRDVPLTGRILEDGGGSDPDPDMVDEVVELLVKADGGLALAGGSLKGELIQFMKFSKSEHLMPLLA